MREIILLNKPVYSSNNSKITGIEHVLIPISRIIKVEPIRAKVNLTDEARGELKGISSDSDCSGSCITYYNEREEAGWLVVVESTVAINNKIYPEK